MIIVLVVVVLVSLYSTVAVNNQFEKYITKQEQIRREKIVDDLQKTYEPLKKSWDEDSLHSIGMYSLYDGYVLTVFNTVFKFVRVVFLTVTI